MTLRAMRQYASTAASPDRHGGCGRSDGWGHVAQNPAAFGAREFACIDDHRQMLDAPARRTRFRQPDAVPIDLACGREQDDGIVANSVPDRHPQAASGRP